MQIIISHINTDFDALASLLAAKKLYPDAQVVLSDKQDIRVRQFLNMYRDMFSFQSEKQIDWKEVTEIIFVDVATFKRAGSFADELNLDNVRFIVYDHHPVNDDTIQYDGGKIELVGAAATLLIEEIQERQIPITSFEASIFGLGIYTDTGFFTYKHTTARDFQAASYLMEQGMNLDLIQRFSEQQLDPDQQQLLDELFTRANTFEIDGLDIVVSTYEHDQFIGGLAILTQKILEMKDAAAVISVVEMKNNVFIVGRANSDRINLIPFLKKWNGGGHKHAGSAMIKRTKLSDVEQTIMESLEEILKPAVTAEQIMSNPVKTLTPETTIEEAGELMYRYGHSGYPIVQNNQIVGMITRRDLDKANHHGLGHAPVKAYMTTNVISIDRHTTLEQIQNIIIQHNIGRLPVLNDQGELEGIVTRTNIIEVLHEQSGENAQGDKRNMKENVRKEMKRQLPESIFNILLDISRLASEKQIKVYLIGGIVRDLLLEKKNDDVDLVVEGNGIAFAKSLQETFGGKSTVHEEFGTATWDHPSGLKIDIASSRLEYYDRPASLPTVEGSTLEEDLLRRDFTINAMAIDLSEEKFGQLIDPFSGQKDLYNKTIRILHNLSFVEDPTRILRAVRFEIRFQFKMDEETEQFALRAMEQMHDLSVNRIQHELEHVFTEERPDQAIERLFELNFWQQFHVNNQVKQKSIIHAQRLQQRLCNKQILVDDAEEYWFLYIVIPFYHGDYLEQCARFALTKRQRKLLGEITELKEVSWLDQSTLGGLHQYAHSYSDEVLTFFIDATEQTNERIIDYVMERKRIPKYMTAADLKQLQIKPGPLYSKLFLALEIATLNKQISSKKEAETYVVEWIDKNS